MAHAGAYHSHALECFQSDYQSKSCDISTLVEDIYIDRITSVNVRNSGNCIYGPN